MTRPEGEIPGEQISSDSKPRTKYTAEEVEALTKRADELLLQLHHVLSEITVHLKAVGNGRAK